MKPQSSMNSKKLFSLHGRSVRCPLCHNWMVYKFEPNRGFFIYACDIEMIAIKADDPFVGRWDEAHEKAGKIPCPNCNADMRYFCTSTGFMKSKCPKKACGCMVSNSEPDRDKTQPAATPENPGLLQ